MNDFYGYKFQLKTNRSSIYQDIDADKFTEIRSSDEMGIIKFCTVVELQRCMYQI